jgi:hypothetical protein
MHYVGFTADSGRGIRFLHPKLLTKTKTITVQPLLRSGRPTQLGNTFLQFSLLCTNLGHHKIYS